MKKGAAPDFTKCQQKFSDKWQKTEAKAGPGVCPSEGDESSMDARITLDAAEIATLLAGGGTSCFAGHCDWRVPNARELQRIVDYEVFSPAVDPAFHQSATCTGCTDVTLSTCSCTASSFYWASTTRQASAFNAWGVVFSNGDVSLGCELRDDARWGALLLV